MTSQHATGEADPGRFEPPDAGISAASRSDALGARYPIAGGARLGRLLGVDVRVDWSLLIIFALVTLGLATSVLPAWHPGWSAALTWGVALTAAVLFFASVLAHELSHAIVARGQGVPVRQVTLFLFGGIAHMEAEPNSPKAEFLIAIVGPLVSIAIGIGAWFAGSVLASPAFSSAFSSAATIDDPAKTMAQVGAVATLLLWLGPVNVILGVFNLVPGFPLDGGRVLHAILWWTTGDLLKSSRWASRVGQGFAWLLMALGMWTLLVGGLGQGLWLLLIGWFLNNAARISYRQLVVRTTLQGVPVEELMQRRFDRITAGVTAKQLVNDYFMTSDQRAFPVESANGRFLGLVCLDDIRRLDRARWDGADAASVMTPREKLTTLPPHAGAERALEQMARRDVEQIPVLEGDRLLGLVRRRDLLNWVAIHDPDAGSRLVGA